MEFEHFQNYYCLQNPRFAQIPIGAPSPLGKGGGYTWVLGKMVKMHPKKRVKFLKKNKKWKKFNSVDEINKMLMES